MFKFIINATDKEIRYLHEGMAIGAISAFIGFIVAAITDNRCRK